MKRSIARGLLCAALTTLALNVAYGTQISISPTRVALTPEQRVGTLTLRNNSDEPMDYQVAVRRWTMDEAGQWLLEPLPAGESLVIYPLGFRIMPGKAQVIRIGVAKTSAIGNERAYRVLIRQLPPVKAPDEPAGLRVLNELSLPVFIGEAEIVPEIRVVVDSILRGRWSFRIEAQGDGHLNPAPLQLRLLDASGKVLHTEQVKMSYLLAGGAHPFAVTVSGSGCETAVRFELEGPSPFGKHQGTLPVGQQRSCGS